MSIQDKKVTSAARNRMSMGLLLVVLLGSTLGLRAQTTNMYWVGGSSTNWSDAANWDLAGTAYERVPGPNDIVHLGFAADGDGAAISNSAQNIHINIEDAAIHSLVLEPTSNRTVDLSGAQLSLTGSDTLVMTENATTNARIRVNTVSGGNFFNNSPTAQLSIEGSSDYSRRMGAGTVKLGGRMTQRNFYLHGPGITLFDGQGVLRQPIADRFFATGDPVIYLVSDSNIGHEWRGEGSASFALLGSDEDLTLNIQRGFNPGDPTVQRMYIIENPDGSSGNLIVQTRQWHSGSLEVVTREGSIVELNQGGQRMEWADNAGISGAGSLWRTTTGVFTIEGRAMTYTGRTMLQAGTLHMNAYIEDEGGPGETLHEGRLPPGTIVELHTSATLDLNGVDQTVGGMTGFVDRHHPVGATNEAGTVTLGGATLTINAAATNTSFAGTISGAGALVKAGAEAFTLAGGYTNAAGRTLRVEEGLLEVTGTLDVGAGTFEVAGGRVAANSLSGAAGAFAITLTTGDGYLEGEPAFRLIDVTGNADLDGATLTLSVAAGYEPALDTHFRLLGADSLSGAGQGGALFQYSDGDTFTADGVDFRVEWVDGSENILLTVIPEPGSLALLALALSGLLLRRRLKV